MPVVLTTDEERDVWSERREMRQERCNDLCGTISFATVNQGTERGPGYVMSLAVGKRSGSGASYLTLRVPVRPSESFRCIPIDRVCGDLKISKPRRSRAASLILTPSLVSGLTKPVFGIST